MSTLKPRTRRLDASSEGTLVAAFERLLRQRGSRRPLGRLPYIDVGADRRDLVDRMPQRVGAFASGRRATTPAVGRLDSKVSRSRSGGTIARV